MVMGTGSTNRYLSAEEMGEIVAAAAASTPVEGKRVLIIIPDGTRTMPMPTMLGLFQKYLRPHVKGLDDLVALGTHPRPTACFALVVTHDGVAVSTRACWWCRTRERLFFV